MARSFNGSTDWITCSALPLSWPGGLTLTLAAWIKTGVSTGTEEIIDSDNGGGARFYQFRVSSGKLQAILFQSSTARTWTSSASVSDGNWHHVAFTYDGTTGTPYIDGIADGAANLVATNKNTGLTHVIGRHLAGGSNFTGSIAEVVISAPALTTKQITSLAAGLPASHLGPDHYWPLWGLDSPEPDIGNG